MCIRLPESAVGFCIWILFALDTTQAVCTERNVG